MAEASLSSSGCPHTPAHPLCSDVCGEPTCPHACPLPVLSGLLGPAGTSAFLGYGRASWCGLQPHFLAQAHHRCLCHRRATGRHHTISSTSSVDTWEDSETRWECPTHVPLGREGQHPGLPQGAAAPCLSPWHPAQSRPVGGPRGHGWPRVPGQHRGPCRDISFSRVVPPGREVRAECSVILFALPTENCREGERQTPFRLGQQRASQRLM